MYHLELSTGRAGACHASFLYLKSVEPFPGLQLAERYSNARHFKVHDGVE
jgi:hypothetical protein